MQMNNENEEKHQNKTASEESDFCVQFVRDTNKNWFKMKNKQGTIYV